MPAQIEQVYFLFCVLLLARSTVLRSLLGYFHPAFGCHRLGPGRATQLPQLLRRLVLSVVGRVIGSSPTAIRMTLTALPITSTGRFSPYGAFGFLSPALLAGKHTTFDPNRGGYIYGQRISCSRITRFQDHRRQ